MRIALAGSGRLGVGILRALSGTRHEIVAIVQDGRTTTRFWRFVIPVMGRIFGGQNSITGAARRKKIPIVWLDKMDEKELGALRVLDIDILLVGGFSIILKQPILDVPKVACVNTHSSLLPRHRGPNPFYAAIVSGDKESGVTFHLMDTGIDTGAVLFQKSFALKERETMVSLYVRSCDLAAEEIAGVLDGIEKEGVQATPQDEYRANYMKNPTMHDSWMYWSESAEALDRKVRAMSPRIMPRFKWRGRQILVAKSRWEKAKEGAAHEPGTVLGLRPMRVATADGVFVIEGAFTIRPVYWLWPNPWQKVGVGDILR